jgi:hypothetical protein
MDLWLRYRRTWWWPWLPWAPAILIPALALIVTAVEVWGR